MRVSLIGWSLAMSRTAAATKRCCVKRASRWTSWRILTASLSTQNTRRKNRTRIWKTGKASPQCERLQRPNLSRERLLLTVSVSLFRFAGLRLRAPRLQARACPLRLAHGHGRSHLGLSYPFAEASLCCSLTNLSCTRHWSCPCDPGATFSPDAHGK